MFLEADNNIGRRYLTLRYLLAGNVDVAMHVGLEGSEFVGGKPQEMPSVSLGKVENKDHFTVIGERYSSSRLHDGGRRRHGLARGSHGDDYFLLDVV